jgi:hypothetical protein
MIESRMRSGTHFLEMLWFFTAERIINETIRFYQLDNERARALRTVYLRPGDYSVQIRDRQI